LLSCLVIGFLQNRTQALSQLGYAEGFMNNRKFVYCPVTSEHISRVARSKQYLDLVAPSLRFAGKLDTIRSIRHYDIAEKEIKFPAAIENPDGFATIPGAENPIAGAG
jgi:hypothetical protein